MNGQKEHLRVVGGRKLAGAVRIGGAKNAVLPILAATVLTAGECVIHDVPAIRDVDVMLGILTRLGAQVTREETASGITVTVCTRDMNTHEVDESLTREMRSSIFLMGPLLARANQVRIAHPGGCAIGSRPIDFHLRGLGELGAIISERHGYIEALAPRLVGRELYLDFPSVGATENLMMAATRAEGVTLIRGAAREPEIVDLQTFLNAMGARVKGAGLDVIRVEGVQELHGVEHTVIPDRIEVGTFMAAAAISGGDVYMENAIYEHVEAAAAKLREMRADVLEEVEGVRVLGPERLHPVDVKTLPYPGFPTDLQPQIMALAAVADGTSIITETIFEGRFKQADELRRMGAQIRVEGRAAIVRGVDRLTSAHVRSPALREGAALVLAGLVAEGVTLVGEVIHIDRGYDQLERKLRGLGADVSRIALSD